MNDKELNEKAVALTKALTDQGKIIEGNWMGYRLLVVPKGAGAVQVEECRRAFFAGAQALFASIMTILDPGTEPTEKALKRMDAIDAELRAFAASVEN